MRLPKAMRSRPDPGIIIPMCSSSWWVVLIGIGGLGGADYRACLTSGRYRGSQHPRSSNGLQLPTVSLGCTLFWVCFFSSKISSMVQTYVVFAVWTWLVQVDAGRWTDGRRWRAMVGRTEQLDAANLGEDLLGEDLIAGDILDVAFRHDVRGDWLRLAIPRGGG